MTVPTSALELIKDHEPSPRQAVTRRSHDVFLGVVDPLPSAIILRGPASSFRRIRGAFVQFDVSCVKSVQYAYLMCVAVSCGAKTVTNQEQQERCLYTDTEVPIPGILG